MEMIKIHEMPLGRTDSQPGAGDGQGKGVTATVKVTVYAGGFTTFEAPGSGASINDPVEGKGQALTAFGQLWESMEEEAQRPPS
jgi:hypothetical protein